MWIIQIVENGGARPRFAKGAEFGLLSGPGGACAPSVFLRRWGRSEGCASCRHVRLRVLARVVISLRGAAGSKTLGASLLLQQGNARPGIAFHPVSSPKQMVEGLQRLGEI